MRINRRGSATAALVTALVLSQSVVGSAEAADYPVAINFAEPSTLTLEYGQYWSYGLTAEWGFYPIFQNNAWVVPMTGGGGSYSPMLYMYLAGGGLEGSLSADYNAPPLPAGAYTFKVGGEYTDYYSDTFHGETPTAAQLTVTPAKLGVELRVLADPANPDAAIVTAKFTGRFVDEYQSSFFSGAATSPGGIWNITVTDSNGDVATERSIERAAGDDVMATSFYWTDAEPGEQYTASAVFTPEGASANNFTITQPANFDYTASESQRPVPTSTAAAQTDTSLPEPTGFSLPVWLLFVVGLLIVGLAVLVTIFSVRLSRRSTATTSGVVA